MQKKIIYIFLLILLVIFQFWTLYLGLQYPASIVSVEKTADDQWIVESLSIRSIASHMDLQEEDRIVTIDDVPAGEYWSVRYWRNIDQFNTLTVSRNGELIELSTADVPALNSNDILSLIAEVISFLLAFILFKKVTGIRSSRYLGIVFLNIGIIFMSLITSTRGDLIGKMMIATFMILLPLFFYKFLMAYIKEKGVEIFDISRVVRGYYLFVIIIVGIQLVYFTNYDPLIFAVYEIITPFTLAVAVLGIAANFLVLLAIHFKHRLQENYRSTVIKTVFAVLLLSLAPIIVFSFIPRILFDRAWISPVYMSWFIFVFPLSFVYLLATRRLYDVDVIVRRMLLAVVIAMIPALLFTGMVRAIVDEPISVEKLVVILLVTLLVMSVLLYSLENVTLKLEPVVFPRKNRLKLSLKNIARNMGNISSLQELRDVVLVDIVNTLEVSGGAIVFCYKDHKEMILQGKLSEQDVEAIVSSGHGGRQTGADDQRHSQSLQEDTRGDDKYRDYLLFEISRTEQYTSYLVMSPKRENTALGAEEVNWLSLIIEYLTMSLENVHLINKLNTKLQKLSALIPDEEEAQNLIWFRKLMFELQERERVRIAMDLHDTTMQDLFYLKGRLELLQEKYKETLQSEKLMESCLEYIDIINMNLRQSCFELHPYLLKEIGLVATLHQLFETERPVNNFHISFITSEVEQIEQLDMDRKRHLFRLVQELVNNAKKHSQASILRFSIYIRNQQVHFEYMDDGVGYEPGYAAQEIGSSGIGVEQIKSRILSLGGRYELKTGSGRGVRFCAHFPVAGKLS